MDSSDDLSLGDEEVPDLSMDSSDDLSLGDEEVPDLSMDSSDDLSLGDEEVPDLLMDSSDDLSFENEGQGADESAATELSMQEEDKSKDLSDLSFDQSNELPESSPELDALSFEDNTNATMNNLVNDTMGLADDLSHGDDQDELSEPDLNFDNTRAISDSELNPVDESLSFNVNSDDAASADKEDEQLEQSTSVQDKLDEIDSFMNEAQTKDEINVEASDNDQLIRLTETIKYLRQDRDELEKKLGDIESGQMQERRNFQLYKSQLEEKNIEIDILTKRFAKQIEKLERNLELANRQKEILMEQNKKISSNVENSVMQKEIDINRIRKREIELENKLEMLKNDSKIQLKSREDKIVELKRRIDTLEFDMSVMQKHESKGLIKRGHLEEKLDRVIGTLRDAIEELETKDSGIDSIQALSEKLKNSM